MAANKTTQRENVGGEGNTNSKKRIMKRKKKDSVGWRRSVTSKHVICH